MNWIKQIIELFVKSTKNSKEDSSSTITFKKPKRPVNKVFVHCSATDNPDHDNVETITKWHKARGFTTIGYHFYIDREGTLHTGRNLELIPAAQYGHNDNSIAICVFGLTNFSTESLDKLSELCHVLNKAYKANITFHGHCEVSNKTCPVFDYKKVLGLDEDGNLNG